MTERTEPRPRTLLVLGLRGIPDVQGGIEAHVAALTPRLVQRGFSVEVLGRKAYLPPGEGRTWKGVRVTPLWAPRSRFFEALVHTALGVLVAARRRPDIVHIHAIGPALLVPLARLLGLRVVVTHHGFDYERQKWGRLARAALRLGERVGMAYAHGRIGVSQTIVDALGSAVVYIPNGVEVRAPRKGTSRLNDFGLMPRCYILSVARIVEEKRQLDLIAAFGRLSDPDIRLAVVGSAEHGGRYRDAVEAAAAATPGVVLTGFQNGETLAQLYAHAALFVLPSSHEGMPIALLEALGYGLPVLASDIPANRAIGLDENDYVPVGDVEGLVAAIGDKLAAGTEAGRSQADRIAASFSWDQIADQTTNFYEVVLARESTRGDAEMENTGFIEGRM